MAVLASWQSHVTETTGRVCAWFESAGTMGLIVNGQTFTGSATNDGDIAYCDFEAPAGFSGQATITLDGITQNNDRAYGPDSLTRTVWTQRPTGPWRFMWSSCANPYRELAKSAKWVRDFRPDVYFWIGDSMYHEVSNLTHYGLTRNNPEGDLAQATAETSAAWNAQRMFLRKPSMQYIFDSCVTVIQWDDHEILSDFRNDLAGMQAQFAWIADQATLDAVKLVRVKLAAGVIHPWADEVNGPFYRTIDYGPCRFILPDLVSESGARLGTTKMSATQYAWYLAQFPSPKAFTLGLHTKTATNGNADSWYYWGGFTDANSQLRGILAKVAATQSSVYGVMTGDLHYPNVQYNADPLATGSPTAFSPYLGVCACQENQFDISGPTTSDIVWKKRDHCVGLLEVPADESYIEYSIVNLSSVLWRGRQYPGSNELVYPTKVGA